MLPSPFPRRYHSHALHVGAWRLDDCSRQSLRRGVDQDDAVDVAHGEMRVPQSITDHVDGLHHQPRGGVEGQESDISILAKEIIRLKKLSIEYLAKDTGKTTDKIAEDIERDFFMSAQEAADYGVIDQVMPSRK